MNNNVAVCLQDMKIVNRVLTERKSHASLLHVVKW